ncbi:MAG: hypothetical protein ISR50_18530 [Alphaproteobacteria bacterium]|nr:hypothetical protein [Alphaproteobacteria bacterium]
MVDNRIANLVTIGGGLLFGGILLAAWTGALTPVWFFFLDGLIQHFISMQEARFSCF